MGKTVEGIGDTGSWDWIHPRNLRFHGGIKKSPIGRGGLGVTLTVILERMRVRE
jgi:hypothetical protein